MSRPECAEQTNGNVRSEGIVQWRGRHAKCVISATSRARSVYLPTGGDSRCVVGAGAATNEPPATAKGPSCTRLGASQSGTETPESAV